MSIYDFKRTMLRKSTITAILVAIVLVSVLAGQILATPGESIVQQIDCNNPRGTPEINYCAEESYKAADRRLNQVYQQLTSKVSGEEKRQLIAAQRAWIGFRDRNCIFENYNSQNGTGYLAYFNECLERMTKQRTADLERYISR